MRLVIIDNYDSFTFNLVQMLGELAGERPLVFKNDEVGAREIEAKRPDGVVLSPGPGHPRDAGNMVQIIRDLDPEIPIFGVCLGHQAIVEAEGGKVIGAGVIMHGKTSEVFHNADSPMFERVPTPFVATRYHSLVADRATFPITLRETAQTPDGLIMALEHTQRPVFGVQFHPESIATGAGNTILSNFVDLCQRSGPVSRAVSTTVPMEFAKLLDRVIGGGVLSRDLTRSLGERILAAELSPAQIGALALALRVRGEEAEEVTGLALAFRNAITPIPTKRPVVNITGTGGDSLRTFNISTAAALVAAGAGVPVAKSVDWARTSFSGSLDVTEMLGIPLDLKGDELAGVIDEIGIGFFRADDFHRARRLIPKANEIGERNIFNLVAPMLNAAGAERHVIGVHSDSARGPVIRSLKALGARRALVVWGSDGIDELTTIGTSYIAELGADGAITERALDARDLGLSRAKPEDIRGGGPGTNARLILEILEGERSARADIVALNAAAVLVASGAVSSFELAIGRCFDSIASGAARDVLERLRALRDRRR